MALSYKRTASVSIESESFKKAKIENIDAFPTQVDSQDENKDPCRESELLKKSKRYPSGEHLSSSNRNRGDYYDHDLPCDDDNMLVWEKDADRAKNFGNDVNIRENHPGVHRRPHISVLPIPWNQPSSRYNGSSPFPNCGPNGFGPAVSSRDHRMPFNGPMRTDFREPFHPNYRGSDGARNSLVSDRYDCQRKFDEPIGSSHDYKRMFDQRIRPDLRESNNRDRTYDSSGYMMSRHDHWMTFDQFRRPYFGKPFHPDYQRTFDAPTRSNFRKPSHSGDNRRMNSTPMESNNDPMNSKESMIRSLRSSNLKKHISRNLTDATAVAATNSVKQFDLPSLMSLDTYQFSGFPRQAEPFESSPVVVQPSQLNYIKLLNKIDELSKKPEEEEKKKPKSIFDSYLKSGTLQHSYLILSSENSAAVKALYSGKQCGQCGIRFAMESDGKTDRFKDHLDWHFRQNRLEKNSSGIKKINSRPWYCRKDDWIQLEKNEDLEDRDTKQTVNVKTQPPSVPTSSGDDGLCGVCDESFEYFFDEEKEEWHLRPAVAFEGKSYHPLCLEDHKKALERSALELDGSTSENEEDVEGNGEVKDDEKMEDLDSDDDKLYIAEDTKDTTELDEVEDFFDEKDGDAENDEPEAEKSFIAEAAAADTTQIAMKSSIDGNAELDSVVRTIPIAPSKIQLKSKVLVASKKPKSRLKQAKPSLQGKRMTILPADEKAELTGFCSIM